LNDARFFSGNYDTSFIDKLRPFSSKDGEIAAALISLLPKKIEFLDKYVQEVVIDPWTISRFDTIDLFNRNYNVNKWIR
jgi:hypothetical protein